MQHIWIFLAVLRLTETKLSDSPRGGIHPAYSGTSGHFWYIVDVKNLRCPFNVRAVTDRPSDLLNAHNA